MREKPKHNCEAVPGQCELITPSRPFYKIKISGTIND